MVRPIHTKSNHLKEYIYFSLNCFWWTRGPFLYLFSSAAPQRAAYSEVPSQMAAHPRIGVHCRPGRFPDSNRGLQVYSLLSLPMSYHCFPGAIKVSKKFKNLKFIYVTKGKFADLFTSHFPQKAIVFYVF